ncbi:hypothetical protein Tco_0543244 [Tanacetum coccineum]
MLATPSSSMSQTEGYNEKYGADDALDAQEMEAQSNKLDLVVKAQSSSEKRLRKYVAKEVGKVVANEAKKAVVEEVGKATQKILDVIRIRSV